MRGRGAGATLVPDRSRRWSVVGAHGWSRGGPPGGSVSAAVRHRANVPVVIVPVDARRPARDVKTGMEAV